MHGFHDLLRRRIDQIPLQLQRQGLAVLGIKEVDDGIVDLRRSSQGPARHLFFTQDSVDCFGNPPEAADFELRDQGQALGGRGADAAGVRESPGLISDEFRKLAGSLYEFLGCHHAGMVGFVQTVGNEMAAIGRDDKRWQCFHGGLNPSHIFGQLPPFTFMAEDDEKMVRNSK